MSYPQQSGDYQHPYPQPGNPAGYPQQPAGPTPYGGPGFPDQNPPQKASGNGCLWGCLIAGLIGLVVLVGVCIGGVYYVSYQGKQLGIMIVRFGVVQGIEQSDLTAEDKKQVIAEVDRLVEAYKKGEIDEQDAANIMEELQTSPLIPLFVCFGIEKQYLDKSGLSDAEKADAKKQLQRLVRGGMDKKIDQNELEELMAPLQQIGPKGEKQLKQTLTDEEIKTFIAGAKELADEAEVPDEAFKIDIGDEVKRVIDRGLAKEKK